MNRRGLITGLGALFMAAPAIVRASSLMPFSTVKIGPEKIVRVSIDEMAELIAIRRKAFMPRMYIQLYETSPLLGKLLTSARSV